MSNKPARKRIVPQLVVSSPEAQSDLPDAPGSEALPVPPATSLLEQARLGKELLGPDRKIYVDLSSLNDEDKRFNWKQVRHRLAAAEAGGGASRASPASNCLTARRAAAQGARRAPRAHCASPVQP